MIGTHYWTTGPILNYHGDNKWGISLPFKDDGFCNEESTEGEIHSRYISGDLDLLISTILKDAEKLGIDTKKNEQSLYVYQDGTYKNDKNYPEMPENWRSFLSTYAEKYNLKWIY